MTRDYYTTSNVRFKYDHYCIFCGKKIEKVEESVGERDWEEHFPCHCEGAVEEQRLLKAYTEAKYKLNNHINKSKIKNTILMLKQNQEKEVQELSRNDLSLATENLNIVP